MSFKMKGFPYPGRSTEGYRKDSPDKDNACNIIPGNKITMKEKDGKPLQKGKILGIGNKTGNAKVMKPGKDYTFKGDTEVLETPMKQKPKWKSKLKTRKDGTFRKVVTKSKRGSGNKEHKGLFSGGRYRSVIKFDETGKIISAKNNRTKNKHKKDARRISRASWIKRDMSPYEGMYTVRPEKKSKKSKNKNKSLVEKRMQPYR